jgi:hypothetical protein
MGSQRQQENTLLCRSHPGKGKTKNKTNQRQFFLEEQQPRDEIMTAEFFFLLFDMAIRRDIAKSKESCFILEKFVMRAAMEK